MCVGDKVRWLAKYQTAQSEMGTDGKLWKACVCNSGTCLSLYCMRSNKLVYELGVSYFISFHWNVQNLMIPCHSQELLQFLSVIYFFFPPFSTNYSSILTPSCHLFLGLPLLVVSKFIYNIFDIHGTVHRGIFIE